ncbi:MAG: nitroreductase family protein [Myxococcota bacterium]
MKDDGAFSREGGPSPLQRILLARRSHRKFGEGQATEEQIGRMMDAVALLMEKAGLRSARLEILGPGPERRAVIKGAMRGLLGKINPWLPFAKAGHMILCGAVYPPGEERRGVERAVAEAAMAMQMAVLAATEQGLATCWLAGIHHEGIEEAYSMKDGAKVVAISPLGLPAARMGISWDAVAHHLVSKKRKPLDEIWMNERWGGGAGS